MPLKHPVIKNLIPKKIDDFYANTDDEPIYAGFKNKVDVHVGISGSMVFKTNGLWDKISSENDQSAKRALYLHIPFCLARCRFCSFYQSHTKPDELEKYTDYIIKELQLTAKSNFAKSKPFDAVYFGGGTPTDLSVSSFKKILSLIKESFPLTNDCEITVEGRITGFDDNKIETCVNHGVNRFSFGIQSFDSNVRKQMGRIESQETILKRLNEIKNISNTMISVDLIYGLPDQNIAIWENDLKRAYETEAIDSVSIYNLKFLPGSPIQDLVNNKKLNPPASLREQADIFMFTKDFFSKINANRHGLRHWSFSNRERSIYNFIPKYEQTVLPVGCGAGGKTGNYKLMQRLELDDYYKLIDNNQKPIKMAVELYNDIEINGYFIGVLEEFLQIDFDIAEKKFKQADLFNRFKPLLNQWEKAGMINIEGKLVKLTTAGEFYNVNIAQNIIEFYNWSKR